MPHPTTLAPSPAGEGLRLNIDRFMTLAAVEITVPGPGFVLVTGGAVVVGDGAAVVRLRDAADASALNVSPILTVGADSNTKSGSVTPTWVFQVVAAGPKSFVIEAKGPNTLVSGGASAQITALFVPFGSTGEATP